MNNKKNLLINNEEKIIIKMRISHSDLNNNVSYTELTDKVSKNGKQVYPFQIENNFYYFYCKINDSFELNYTHSSTIININNTNINITSTPYSNLSFIVIGDNACLDMETPALHQGGSVN